MKAIICCVLLCLVSGCTGIELGGRVGLYRVDERQESSRTNVENKVPLKCYFVDCSQHVETLDPK